MVDRAELSAHAHDSGQLRFGPLHLGRGCLVQANNLLWSGVVLGEGYRLTVHRRG